jgi:hypothetical protein
MAPKDNEDRFFGIDSFVSQLAGWIDKEVTIEQPTFKAFGRGDRISRICIELEKCDVAVSKSTETISAWATSSTISERIGGSKVCDNERFFSCGTDARLLDQFQSAVIRHMQRRLASMLETQEAMFEMFDLGPGISSKNG